MHDLMAQSVGLAQQDFEGWANILFVLAMVILWLVGALVKALSKKGPTAGQEEPAAEQHGPRESWQERLRRKAEELQRRMEEEAGLREPGEPARTTRETPARTPAPPGGRIRVRPGQGGESVIVYEQPPTPSPTQHAQQAARQREARKAAAAARTYGAQVTAPIDVRVPEFRPIATDMTGVMAERPAPLEPGAVQMPSARESAGWGTGDILDYRDPDTLKKAILHYEILGKPLALRDETDQTSAF